MFQVTDEEKMKAIQEAADREYKKFLAEEKAKQAMLTKVGTSTTQGIYIPSTTSPLTPSPTQVSITYGWVCPVCGAALSPYTSTCNHGSFPKADITC